MEIKIIVKFDEEDKARIKKAGLTQKYIKERMTSFEHDMYDSFEDIVGYAEDKINKVGHFEEDYNGN